MQVSEETINQAFNAIHDEAVRILGLPPDQREGQLEGALHLIISLSRYRFDIRPDGEVKRVERDA